MSEYKNGVNYRGNMSVEVKDRNPEVHTGRAVFIDDELYEKDSVYKARVDKCLEEGFHPVKDSGGGGGSTTVEALSVPQNGTYAAPQGRAYSPVAVNVRDGSTDLSS